MKIFFIRGGGGGGGGRGVEGRDWGIFNRKNNSIGSRLFFFVLMLYIKFQVPGSSGSLV